MNKTNSLLTSEIIGGTHPIPSPWKWVPPKTDAVKWPYPTNKGLLYLNNIPAKFQKDCKKTSPFNEWTSHSQYRPAYSFQRKFKNSSKICDSPDWFCLGYLPKEYCSQVSKRFKKHFWSYHADKVGHTDGQTDGWVDVLTDSGNENTPSALGPMGNKMVQWKIFIFINWNWKLGSKQISKSK